MTVAVTVPAGTDVSVDEASLRFTSTNWTVEKTVTVRVADDDDALADETVTLTHEVRGGDYGANGETAEPVEVVIIENDTPTLSVSDQRAVEASGEMVFTVRLSEASSDEVVVDYGTADGTAEAGSDYSEATGKLTFAAETTAAQEIRVSIADDTVDEDEEETFTVTLSGACECDAGRRRDDAVGDGDDRGRRRPGGDGGVRSGQLHGERRRFGSDRNGEVERRS